MGLIATQTERQKKQTDTWDNIFSYDTGMRYAKYLFIRMYFMYVTIIVDFIITVQLYCRVVNIFVLRIAAIRFQNYV